MPTNNWEKNTGAITPVPVLIAGLCNNQVKLTGAFSASDSRAFHFSMPGELN
jgi:hypothetical protein